MGSGDQNPKKEIEKKTNGGVLSGRYRQGQLVVRITHTYMRKVSLG